MLRPHRPSFRTAIVALALTAVVLSACTSSGAPSASHARTNEPVDEGLAEEIAEQQEVADERTEALEAAVLPNGVVVFAQISFSYTGPHNAAEGVQRIHVFTSHDDGGTWSEQVVDESSSDASARRARATATSTTAGRRSRRTRTATWWSSTTVRASTSVRRPSTPAPRRTAGSRGATASRSPRTAPTPRSPRPSPRATTAFVWFMAQRNQRWEVWYRTTDDLGATWSTREKLSDATSGTVYKHPTGFDEVYGDYGEIAITSDGHTIGVWGEGKSFYDPGGVWFNRQT